MKKIIQKKVRKYFKFFERKDLKGLEKMFANSIILKDWDHNIDGKVKLINFLKKIFLKENFKIKILNLYANKKKNIACEILVSLKNKKNIKIVDVISFNKKYKIIKIQAYKC